jgi:hypothetical protein
VYRYQHRARLSQMAKAFINAFPQSTIQPVVCVCMQSPFLLSSYRTQRGRWQICPKLSYRSSIQLNSTALFIYKLEFVHLDLKQILAHSSKPNALLNLPNFFFFFGVPVTLAISMALSPVAVTLRFAILGLVTSPTASAVLGLSSLSST